MSSKPKIASSSQLRQGRGNRSQNPPSGLPTFPRRSPTTEGIEWPARNPRERLSSRRREAAAAAHRPGGHEQPPVWLQQQSAAGNCRRTQVHSSLPGLRDNAAVQTPAEPSASEMCLRTVRQPTGAIATVAEAPATMPLLDVSSSQQVSNSDSSAVSPRSPNLSLRSRFGARVVDPPAVVRGVPTTRSTAKATSTAATAATALPKRMKISNTKKTLAAPAVSGFPYADPYAIPVKPDAMFLAYQARMLAISKAQTATVKAEAEKRPAKRRRTTTTTGKGRTAACARLSSCSSSDIEGTRRGDRHWQRNSSQEQALLDAQGLLHTLQIQPSARHGGTQPGGSTGGNPTRRRGANQASHGGGGAAANTSSSVRQTGRRASIADPFTAHRRQQQQLFLGRTPEHHGDCVDRDGGRPMRALRRFASLPIRESPRSAAAVGLSRRGVSEHTAVFTVAALYSSLDRSPQMKTLRTNRCI